MRLLDRTRVIDGKRYNTETATLIAGNDWWDGNYERQGTNLFLLRTPKGRYFTQSRTCWEGTTHLDGNLEPVTTDEAIDLYTHTLTEHEMEFEAAFPGVEIEEA